jgi:hypothetical protein
MGGDLGHHASQWRPNTHLPLRNELSPSPLGPNSKFNIRIDCCSGQVFIDIYSNYSPNTPFLQIKAGYLHDFHMARSALKALEAFDADESVVYYGA